MLLSKQELCQILEKQLAFMQNDSNLEEIQNYILKSDWFKVYNAGFKSIGAEKLPTLEQVINLL